jgi:hypothetical protein
VRSGFLRLQAQEEVKGSTAFGVSSTAQSGEETAQDSQREFLYRLSQHIPEQTEFVIQAAGYEKCRYPVYAVEWVIRPGLVLHASLGESRSRVKPPATLAEIESFDPDCLTGPLTPGASIDEAEADRPESNSDQGTSGEDGARFDYETPGPFHAWDTATIRDVRDVLQQVITLTADPIKEARLQWVFEALGSKLPPAEGARAIARYEFGYGRHETADLELTPEQARQILRRAIQTDDVDPEYVVRFDDRINHLDE